MLDEMMVTKSTFPKVEWSLPNKPMCLDIGQQNTKPIAVLGAVSRENGMDMYMLFKKSVDQMKFKTFLQELRDKYPFDDIHLIMDNLSVHKTLSVRERMDELGFEYSWIPPYSPQYNGIEEVWSQVKRKIK